MSCRWFHPHINGKEAEQLLMQQGRDGSFLVRRSTRSKDDFSISVRWEKLVHIKIQNTGDGFDLFGGEVFATLAELVQYYLEDKGTLTVTGNIIKLKYPLTTVDPTAERWFHGYLSGKEAEQALMEKGKDHSYLVRESQSKPGDFVLSARDEDRVFHIKIVCKDGKLSLGGEKEFASLVELVDNYKQHPIEDAMGSVIHLKHPFNATRVTASHISARIKQLEVREVADEDADEFSMKPGKLGFSDEFEQLQQEGEQLLYSRTEGQRPENKCRNRYKNILPFDNTRVVLKEGDPDVVGSDYINANFIRPEENMEPRKTYIATQGCLKETVADFWRMTWQENSRVIVVTTKEVERGKNKLVKYWPDEKCENHEREFPCYTATFRVKLLKETTDTDFILRELQLVREPKGGKPDEPRIIYQYHFQTWPDYGVPSEPGCVLDLLEKAKARQAAQTDPGPMIVHCSAGIGRTGAFIVVDIMLNQIKAYGVDCDIDIQKTILKLRAQRSGMVQTEGQYRFIYLAVHHYLEMEKQKQLCAEAEYGNIESSQPDEEGMIYQNM
ncbi:tyrosine-protein phosphatase non-receptor type 11-like [Babylonia areolata]|uniref:tyrosine-protein phosphatase non-receptor type 11-like n=1 Tax=Babylonia areolata TaxID=304850 RepID=UPI003FD48B43